MNNYSKSIIDEISFYIEKYKIFFVILTFFIVSAITYNFTTQKIYQVNSRVAIFRIKVEDPDKGSDDSRNRWIWIRDGLNINSALINDVEIKKFIETNELAQLATRTFSDNNAKINYIRSLIQVSYTGADESNYIIAVKSNHPKLSYELNLHFFNYLKYLALQKDQDDFKQLTENIEKTLKTLDHNSSDYQLYKNKLAKMKFEQIVNQTQKENAFQIITAPTYQKNKIWPKELAILVLATLLGALLGFIAEYGLYLFKLNKENDQ